jgi:hypothetical protein
MAIRFCCPSCQKPLEVDTTQAGKEVLCFFCHGRATVPTESDPTLGSPSPEGQLPAVPAVPGKSPIVGYVGLTSSLMLIVLFLAILGWGSKQLIPLARDPNFVKLPTEKQKELVQKKVKELMKSPVRVYGIFALMILAVVGAGFSLVGIVQNRGRISSIFGFLISGTFLALVGYLSIISRHPAGGG